MIEKFQYLVCNTILLQISRWLAFIGKFGVAACFAIIYTFSVELYPTCARGSALGMCSAGARIGGIACPLILGFDQKISWLSNFIFGVASIIASLVALRFTLNLPKVYIYQKLRLPETLGKPLPQTIEEAEENYNRKRYNDEKEMDELEKDSVFENIEDGTD